MRDGWEVEYGLNPIDPSDALVDSDGDTFINREEHTADTNPENNNDYFCVTNVSRTSLFSAYFDSSTSRVYTLYGVSNLVDAVWTNIPGQGPRYGVGGSDWMQDTNSVPARFYRMDVTLP